MNIIQSIWAINSYCSMHQSGTLEYHLFSNVRKLWVLSPVSLSEKKGLHWSFQKCILWSSLNGICLYQCKHMSHYNYPVSQKSDAYVQTVITTTEHRIISLASLTSLGIILAILNKIRQCFWDSNILKLVLENQSFYIVVWQYSISQLATIMT